MPDAATGGDSGRCDMIVIVPIVRALVVILVALVGAGQVLLDSCVLGCHPYVRQTALPEAVHCPGVAAAGRGAIWRATSSCDHAHDQISADMLAQSRNERALRVSCPALVPAPGAAPHQPLRFSALELRRTAAAPGWSSSSLTPLRV